MSAKLNAVNDIAGYLNELPIETISLAQKLVRAIFEHPDPKDLAGRLAEVAVEEVKALARKAEEAARDAAFDKTMTAALPPPKLPSLGG